MRAVKDVVYLLGLDEQPLKSLPIVYDLEGEHIKDDIGILSFSLDMNETIIAEQQIVYRRKRYTISEIEEDKVSQRINIVAEILYVELNHANITFIDIDGETLGEASNRIVQKTKWSVIVQVADEDTHFLREERKSALYLLRMLTRNSGYQIKFDTLYRVAYIVETIGEDLETVFRYRKNIKNIKKTTMSPKATEITPYGRGGLTIESVNDGIDYVEDYSWYESLGFSVEEARERFRKSHTWEDDRYIYAGNLMRAAQNELRVLSHPQIAYFVDASVIGIDADVGDFTYVVDEELGIKVKVEIVRLIDHEDKTRNQYEFNYLIPNLQSDQKSGSDYYSTSTTQDIILVNNLGAVNLQNAYSPVLTLSFSAYAPTNAQVGVTIVGQASQNLLLEGVFEIDGMPVGVRLRQNLVSGWNTITLNFIIDQIQNGSSELRLMARTDRGTFSIGYNDAQLYIRAENLLGGVDSSLPQASVHDELNIPNRVIELLDTIEVQQTSVGPPKEPNLYVAMITDDLTHYSVRNAENALINQGLTVDVIPTADALNTDFSPYGTIYLHRIAYNDLTLLDYVKTFVDQEIGLLIGFTISGSVEDPYAYFSLGKWHHSDFSFDYRRVHVRLEHEIFGAAKFGDYIVHMDAQYSSSMYSTVLNKELPTPTGALLLGATYSGTSGYPSVVIRPRESGLFNSNIAFAGFVGYGTNGDAGGFTPEGEILIGNIVKWVTKWEVVQSEG